MGTKMNAYLSGIESIRLRAEMLYQDGSATLSVMFDETTMNWHFEASAEGRRSWLAARRFKRHKLYTLVVEPTDWAKNPEPQQLDASAITLDTTATSWLLRFDQGEPVH